jgi:hypothetical protein
MASSLPTVPEPTTRRKPLRYHPIQAQLRASSARFKVIEAGRRSGKTEHAKRDGVDAAQSAHETAPYITPYRVGYCAPTRDQAKQIYWDDIKLLVSPWLVEKISETELSIHLYNGAEIWVVGLDKPARVEGRPWHRLYWDEVAECKPGVWHRHIRPTLDTDGEEGSAWMYGVPRPSSEFKMLADLAQDPTEPDFEYFSWPSSDILDPEIIAAAKRTMDPLMYAQEYEASRVNLQGLAYYQFSRSYNTCTLGYVERAPLIFCFDFNVSPGTATVLQEQDITRDGYHMAGSVTCAIGEVWIRQHSTTPMVCRKLIEEWGDHQGRVLGYGDATGGARGSKAVAGSDWEIIDAEMRRAFGQQWHNYVPKSNPPERARVNAVNARLCSMDGTVGFLADPARAPMLVADFESVMVLEGSAGELDKKSDPMATHLTDGVGYYIERVFPVVDRKIHVQKF